MGVEIDPLYKQNLTEWIYDEKKLVTYRYLSVTLGVHVNIAKQMLYEFYNDELRKQKQKNKEKNNNNPTASGIQALYYISGLKNSFSDVTGVVSSFSSTICRDDQVDSVKSEFKKISSVHIYSIQSLQQDDNIIDKLSTAMQETCLLKDDDGRSAVEFGPFKIQKPAKVHVVPQIPPPNASTSLAKPKPTEQKPDVKKNFFGASKSSEKPTKKNDDEKPEDSEKTKEKPSTFVSKPKDNSTKSTPGKPNDRLKNMFAAAASKPRQPKAVKEEKVESEDEEYDSDFESSKKVTQKKPPAKTYGKNNAKNKPKPKEVETNRKRKRVVDILSSSEDEEEEEPRSTKRSNRISSDEEEDSLPESPIPRKRAPRIASDSESEELFPETPEAKKGKLNFARKAKSPPPPESASSGKKHIRKTVTKSYVDEDGFTVTKKEQVWVSASESEEEDKKPEKEKGNKSKPVISSQNEKEKLKEFSSPVVGNKKAASNPPPVPNKKPAKTPPSNAAAPKTKQPTLMSFFTKKA